MSIPKNTIADPVEMEHLISENPRITERDLHCAVINASHVSIILTNGCSATREPNGNVNIKGATQVSPAEAHRLAQWILGIFPEPESNS